jgi:hypothetical protein
VSHVHIAFYLTQLEQHGRLEALSYIVYWYGARATANSYGFVTKSTFIAETSEDYQKHRDKLEASQAEVDTNEKSPRDTQESARKYKEMQEDLLKPPEKRKHGGFREEYELLSIGDVDELISDADESGDGDSGEEKTESKPAPRKRERASTADDDDIEAVLESRRKMMK